MQALAESRTVAELLLENPSRARVFEKYRIDYCCAGKKSLQEAAARRGVAPQLVLDELHACDRGPAVVVADWATRPCIELTHHIVTTHHALVRRELPRLLELAEKVARVHGEHAPEMIELPPVVAGLRDEMDAHMAKEEQVLFPFIERLEAGQDSPFPTIGAPISAMEHDHSDAGVALERIRALTNNLTPPMDACNSWRVLYHGLATFEADLHQHIHKENNILFPKALAMEAALRG